MVDAVSSHGGDEFIGTFKLVDAAHLAATCRELRGCPLPLIVKDGSLDFSRLSTRCTTDAFVQRVLLHVQSIQDQPGPRGMVTDINVRGFHSLTNESMKIIAANCPAGAQC